MFAWRSFAAQAHSKVVKMALLLFPTSLFDFTVQQSKIFKYYLILDHFFESSKSCLDIFRYFMVSQDVETPTFYELSEETFSLLETALSDRFERLWEHSKTNTFDPRSLLNHIQSDAHKPHAQNLRKAIEEIAVWNLI